MKASTTRFTFFTLSLLLAIAAIYITFTAFLEFSGFAAGFAKVWIAVATWWAIDIYLLPEINTIDEIKSGNIAYSLVILSYAVLVGLCVSTA